MKRSKSNILSSKYLKYSLILIVGIFVGWIFFHPSQRDAELHDPSTDTEQNTTWTCAMHPQIRSEEPGDCPICGMDLIPLAQSGTTSIDPDVIHLSKEAAQLANVMTTVVTRQKAVKEIRLYGKVQADERLLQTQVAHVPGRIEKLSVNFTGEQIRQGQPVAEIYSPDLITAQQELLETARSKQLQPELYEASKERLRQWKLTEEQIERIENSGIVNPTIEVVSTTSGIVTQLLVNTGDYVSQGMPLLKISDLSRVWVLFDAYEGDLPFINKGDIISFTLQAMPGIEHNGTIAFVDPVIDPVTRVAKVRVNTDNKSGRLKPEMFATGIVSSTLYEYSNNIVIPRSAVLWTGKRSIVYVKEPDSDEAMFKIREIGIGPMLGDSYVVMDGLSEGEEIVTSGTFSVDAAAQLDGRPSMMNPAGGIVPAVHDHGTQQISKIDASSDFVMQLTTVYDRYINLKNALVDSDANKANQEARKVEEAIAKVDMNLVKGETHTQWMDLLEYLNKSINAISSTNDLEAQRSAFKEFSDQLYVAVKTFGLMKKTIYHQFCPMAFNDQGAYWLSELENIRNPYFGDEMMTCGETKETLKY